MDRQEGRVWILWVLLVCLFTMGAAAAAAPPAPVAGPALKGLQAHPNEFPAQAYTIATATTHWVRLELVMEPDGSLDLAHYDAVVDSIRAPGMGLIGLVDYMTIPEDLDGDGTRDYDDPDDVLAYQQRFVDAVQVLAGHFAGRITRWEIWNEENGAQWHIRPEYYARLLVLTAAAVRQADPANQVLFGGLDHAWATSQYLEPVYDALDRDWAGARPFDILAVHPYFVTRNGQPVLDPKVYLWEAADPSRTILDKYLAAIAARGDADVDIWVTEIGWNSALDNPAIEECPLLKPWCVTRAQQAQYLHDAFDILLKEVRDPAGRRDRVGAIVWYQYHDTGSTLAEQAAKMSIPLDARADLSTVCPADWGLVDAARRPKPAYWAYQAYRRAWTVYLPAVAR
jgi:hypothetical protein